MGGRSIIILAAFLAAAGAQAQPGGLYVDPPAHATHPATMEVLHIPTGGVEINGVAYLAAGPGPHPTIIICHGWPGNEKNLDLAQALRRAGWNAVTFNYRGSWGSPGAFRIAKVPEDAAAVSLWLRPPEVAARLRVDLERLVLAGHSMGGWAAAMAGARDAGVRGVVLISAADMRLIGQQPRDEVVAQAREDFETLDGTSPEAMADELIAGSSGFSLLGAAQGLASKPVLVLSSNDGLRPQTDALVSAIKEGGGKQVTSAHVETDHGWSDRRIELSVRIAAWLEAVSGRSHR
jgi:pimeloyl-ACP methyl ester carboxylesterase